MSFLRGISCQDIVTLKSCGAGDTNNGTWGRPKKSDWSNYYSSYFQGLIIGILFLLVCGKSLRKTSERVVFCIVVCRLGSSNQRCSVKMVL